MRTPVEGLKKRLKKARQERRRNLIKKTIMIIVYILFTLGFAWLFVNTWVEEVDSHREYNLEYNQYMEEKRAD